MMSISEIVTRKLVTATSKDSLSNVANLMESENVGAIVVVQDNRPIGIVTDRDLALAVCIHGKSPGQRVQEVMTCPVSTISKDEGVYGATQKLMEQAVRRLPVVDENGDAIGLVSLDDLLLLLSRELQNMAEGIKVEAAIG
jgi:signal-transduction protein with cAMP-binding, CBS, and nucleotidyltransferase domain